MAQGHNTYTRFDGAVELREAVARKLADYNDILADPDREITISAGATGAFHCACLALLTPGDEVLVFEPYYGYHLSALSAVEAVPKIVRSHQPDWAIDPADVAKAITSRTKAIVLNSPGNPGGKVWSRSEMEWLAQFAERHDLFVFTDEIYEYFLYDGRRHVSLATLPGMAERTITVGGYSKTFSITGWRIGYSVARGRWAELIGAMNDLLYVCAPAPLQIGVAVGIAELPESFYVELAREFQAKREQFCRALHAAGLPPSVPQGAYYVLADVSRLPGRTGKDRAMFLLDRTGVAGVPAEAFFSGPEGARYLRFSFAKTDRDLDEACRRLERMA
jgi:aminotransferase